MDELDLEFESIYQKVLLYIHKEEDLLLIKHAYSFVKHAFKDILRKDGSPYLKHLLDTASIVVNLQAGPNTIVAALLHDSIEDIDDIKKHENINKYLLKLDNLIPEGNKYEKIKMMVNIMLKDKVKIILQDQIKVI